jgi:hypothetical protein
MASLMYRIFSLVRDRVRGLNCPGGLPRVYEYVLATNLDGIAINPNGGV